VAEALVSLSEAFPLDAAHLSVEEFRACARYYEAMDFILYLREDMPYRIYERTCPTVLIVWVAF
jgi:hypothetical protein